MVLSGVLSPGVAGTTETLMLMQGLVEDGARDPGVRAAALSAIQSARVAPRDYLGELRAHFEYVSRTIRYTPDPSNTEVLYGPQYILSHHAGDCDDMATLLASLLRAIGWPGRLWFKAISTTENPASFSHVYLVAQLGAQVVPMDASVRAPFGWEYPGAVLVKLVEV